MALSPVNECRFPPRLRGSAPARTRPDAAKFAERKPEVEMRLRLRRESELERAWIDELRRRSKVETNRAFVQGDVRGAPVELD